MPREAFRAHIANIAEKFEQLSPYSDGKPFLKIEDQNYSIDGKDLQSAPPLYFLSFGFKKYCEFNLTKQGNPVIRHIAAIGLGDFLLPSGYSSDDSPLTRGSHPAERQGSGDDIFGVPPNAWPLIMDLWRHVIRRFAEDNETDLGHSFRSIRALKTPAVALIEASHPFDAEL